MPCSPANTLSLVKHPCSPASPVLPHRLSPCCTACRPPAPVLSLVLLHRSVVNHFASLCPIQHGLSFEITPRRSAIMPNKPVPRTNSPKPKYSVMTDEQRKALCQKVKDEPRTTQKELVTWLELTHGVKTSQATVSNTLKHCQKLLVAQDVNLRVKRHRVQK